MQRRLIQFLKNGAFTRIGDNEQILSTVRLLATTSKFPEALVLEKKLDPVILTLVGVEILQLKPLSERKKDILAIAEYFLEEYNHRFEKKFLDSRKGQ